MPWSKTQNITGPQGPQGAQGAAALSRPVFHPGSLFTKTSATSLSIAAGSGLNGIRYPAPAAVTMPGSFSNNTDYAIWQHPTTGTLIADASFLTAPAGASGGAIVGGFHFIPTGRPTGFNNGSPTATAEILEFSIWDRTYRPSCPDPRGMACINDAFWIDLYLAGSTSYASGALSAVPAARSGSPLPTTATHRWCLLATAATAPSPTAASPGTRPLSSLPALASDCPPTASLPLLPLAPLSKPAVAAIRAR